MTAEVTPHHLTLTHETVAFSVGEGSDRLRYDTDAKVNPPLREEADVTACVAALRDGVIDAVATDHAPHAENEKEVEFDRAPPGISGLETAFGLCMSPVHAGALTLPTLIERLTVGPARAWRLDERVGLEGLGTLAPGAVGDVALIDPNEAWIVDPREFSSLGHNTPLTGQELRGRVVATVVAGHLVYQHDSVSVL